MNNLGWKEEFEAVNKNNKRSRAIKWATALIIIIGVSFICASYIISAKKPTSNSSSGSVESKPIPYKYSELGELCSKAITDYDNKTTELSDASDALAKKVGGPTYAALAYEQEELPKYNQLSLDYMNQRNQGIISQEEYEQKREIIDKAIEHINDVKTQASIDSNALYISITTAIQTNDNKIKEYSDNRNKLATCVSSANNKQDFSISDVANFESIISDSK